MGKNTKQGRQIEEDIHKDLGADWNANQIEFQRAIAPPDRERLTWRDPENLIVQLTERFENYLVCCQKYNKRIGNFACYNALGTNRDYVSKILNGTFYCKLPPYIIDFFKGVCDYCTTYRETLVIEGKINPVTGIFWQKNFDGLTDVKTVETNVSNPLVESTDVKKLTDKYSKLIVVDAELVDDEEDS